MKTEPSDASPRGEDRDYVQSLERGLAVIRFLGTVPKAAVSEVARQAGITRAAARRFLITLERLGYVGQAGSEFFLLPRTLELGYGYLASQSLPQIVQPHLEKLAQSLQETCSVTVLDRQRILYVARVTINRLVGATLAVGSTLPAYCSAAGRVLLSALPKDALDAYFADVELERLTSKTITSRTKLEKELECARAQGFYITDEELDEGVRSLALPLRDATGSVIAAINVSCYAGRVPLEKIENEFLPKMRETADAINNELKTSRHVAATAR